MDNKLIQQLEESLFREIDANRQLFNCKKISKRLFKEILDDLLYKGWTHEQIADRVEIFFNKAFEHYPELAHNYKSPEIKKQEEDLSGALLIGGSLDTCGCMIMIIPLSIILFLLLLFLIKLFES